MSPGAHPAYKQAIAGAAAGSTEITGAFATCPLCATSPQARVLRSCIHELRDLTDDTAGETTVGGQRITLPKGHGLPPGTAATGHIGVMAMYAGESAAAVPTRRTGGTSHSVLVRSPHRAWLRTGQRQRDATALPAEIVT